MQERLRHKEQVGESLQDITDSLLLSAERVRSIANAPRSFKIKSIDKAGLLAPTALPFEMGLYRVGNALVAETGAEGFFPSHFGVNKIGTALTARADIEERLQLARGLRSLTIEKIKQAGWFLHWHPLQAPKEGPSQGDLKSAARFGGIQFVVDQYGIYAFGAIGGDFSGGEKAVHKDPWLTQIKQIPWSDDNTIQKMCDFLNGDIPVEEIRAVLNR